MKELEDFTDFYKNNQHLRFWQALSIWCGKNIFTSELPAISVVSQCEELQDMWDK